MADSDASPVSEVGTEFKLLSLYRNYWAAAIQTPTARTSAELTLLRGLQRVLKDSQITNIEGAEHAVSERLRKKGWFVQLGRTGVLHDLMIWRKQTSHRELVSLPEGKTKTTVTYLDDFVSEGWSRYLTCGRTGTGGWTTDKGLFVIVPSYASLTDETFRVNFLAHESQHFVDKRRFGTLPAWRLEYRAKLVELAYAEATLAKTLDYFIGSEGDDTNDAHRYANKRVILTIEKSLGLSSAQDLYRTPIVDLHRAAVAALHSDTKALVDERASKTSKSYTVPSD